MSLSPEDLASPETSMHAPRGTPAYMAPEQTGDHRGKIGPQADVHALGAILYRMLTGRPPFVAPTIHETMAMVRDQPPERPRHRNRAIPRDLETIVLTCLEKDPARRYASAAELADESGRWLEGRPILARPASPIERAARACRRNPVVASLCLALASAFCAALIGFRMERSAQQAAERNLETAGAFIHRLGGLVLQKLYGRTALDDKGLAQAVDLLRAQIADADSLGDLHPEVLRTISEIDSHVAARLRAHGRLDEARTFVDERLDLSQRAHEAAPSDIPFLVEFADALIQAGELVEFADALIQAGELAVDEKRPGDAFSAHGRSATLLLGHPGVVPAHRTFEATWWHTALRLSDAYLRLPDVAGHDERRFAWDRELNARVESAIRSGAVDSRRPDVLLFRACLLADRDDWTAAHELFARAFSGNLADLGDDYQQRVLLEPGLDSWATRLAQRWVAQYEAHEGDSRWIEAEADRPGDLIKAMRLDGRIVRIARNQITDKLSTQAKRQRDAGRLDLADRLVQFFNGLADRLVREFPDDPAAYFFLAQAQIQETKNAWKRDDLPAVRRSLSAAVSALRRALELDPNDGVARSMLIEHSRRLAALPAP